MNIFVLHKDPAKAAIMMCDKHIPKMIIEAAQMLCTSHRLLDGTPERRRSKSGKTMQQYYTFGNERDDVYYAAVHKYHPCTVWTMASLQNYNWHYQHFVALSDEFEFRRKKKHATFVKLGEWLNKPPINIPDVGLTEFAQAMSQYPDCIVKGDAVQAYRNYYHTAKPFAKWDWGRSAPDWWEGYQGADVHS